MHYGKYFLKWNIAQLENTAELPNRRYADDTALTEDSQQAVEPFTKNVNDARKKFNLKLNRSLQILT